VPWRRFPWTFFSLPLHHAYIKYTKHRLPCPSLRRMLTSHSSSTNGLKRSVVYTLLIDLQDLTASRYTRNRCIRNGRLVPRRRPRGMAHRPGLLVRHVCTHGLAQRSWRAAGSCFAKRIIPFTRVDYRLDLQHVCLSHVLMRSASRFV
jgi:hypothetical protein